MDDLLYLQEQESHAFSSFDCQYEIAVQSLSVWTEASIAPEWPEYCTCITVNVHGDFEYVSVNLSPGLEFLFLLLFLHSESILFVRLCSFNATTLTVRSKCTGRGSTGQWLSL